MEEGQDGVEGLLAGLAHLRGPRQAHLRVRAQVGVGQAHGLGGAGGAARVEQHGGVVHVGVDYLHEKLIGLDKNSVYIIDGKALLSKNLCEASSYASLCFRYSSFTFS